MPGRGKTEAIFAVRQRMEKHQGKQTVLHMVFKDLEKACDRVPRQKVWRRIREKGVPEKCIRIKQDMYEGAITQVKSSVGLTDKIPVSVGLHQRFFLIPYISPIIMDVSAYRIKDLSPRGMLHADNIVLCGTRREEVEKKLEEWRKINVERKLFT